MRRAQPSYTSAWVALASKMASKVKHFCASPGLAELRLTCRASRSTLATLARPSAVSRALSGRQRTATITHSPAFVAAAPAGSGGAGALIVPPLELLGARAPG